MLTLYYCVWSPLVAERANSVTIVHTCCALAQARPKWQIEIRPTELPEEPEKVFRKLGKEIPPNVRIRPLFPDDADFRDVLNNKPTRKNRENRGPLQDLWRRELEGKRAVVYTRNRGIARFFRELGRPDLPIALELHQLKYPNVVESLINRRASLRELKAFVAEKRGAEMAEIASASLVFCISQPLMKRVERDTGGVPTELLPSGCLAAAAPDEGAERDVDLLYVGQLYFWKGVHTIIEAMRHLGGDTRLTIVGGNTPADVYAARKLAENLGVADLIDWIGQVPHAEALAWQRRARVGLIPLPRRYFIARFCTSPIKAFELMHSGAALLVSDLPSTRSLLTHGENAHFARPDDPRNWARQMEALLGNDAYRTGLASRAREFAASFTYKKRAETIAQVIDTRLLAERGAR